MARAKQTSRADARRRYRQSTAVEPEPVDASVEEPTAESRRARPVPSSARSTNPPSGGGLAASFRGAYRPLHFREDIAAIPQLLVGRWFLVAVGLSALGYLLSVIYPTGITALAESILSLPPGGPTLPVFLVGFTAPRASYLLGLGLGLSNIIVVAVLTALVPSFAGGATISDIVVQGVLYGLPTAVVFATAAAWYRRFLALSSPRRAGSSGGNRSKSRTRAAGARR